jgi:hypothetical protein
VGHATVRAFVVQVLSDPLVTGLAVVFSADPVVERPVKGWNGTPRTLAWASVSIDRSTDIRRSMPRGFGVREVDYRMVLGIHAETKGSVNEATDDTDAVIDAIKTRLLTVSVTGKYPILAIAEGTDPIVVTTPPALTQGQQVIMYSELRFPVIETVTA